MNFEMWLKGQDISIQYLYEKLVLEIEDSKKQKLISTQGYGKYLLSKQNSDGHWGNYYYQPKWTSTHYTLLQLKDLGISPDCSNCYDLVYRMFNECQLNDGGLNLAKSKLPSDICVDGMILNYASYFLPKDERLLLLVDSIILKQKVDGGFTWLDQVNSDPHSTICVLEGLVAFQKYASPEYRYNDIYEVIRRGLTYFYENELFSKEKKYEQLVYPFRYFYSIFRFLLLATNLNIKDNHLIKESSKKFTSMYSNPLVKLEKEYRGKEFICFSKINEINPFLSVYGEYIRKFYTQTS